MIVFDHVLNKKSEKLFDIEESIGIYSVFKKSNGNEIIFYCPDNQLLIHANVLDDFFSIINLGSEYEDVTFSTIYHWNGDILLLSDFRKLLSSFNNE